MDGGTLLIAAFLGLLEGLTEFIPVSSTGHLLLAGHFLGFESKGKVFEVAIQFGAVLAILAVYAARLIGVAHALPHEVAARRFVAAVGLAFLPAAGLGALGHDLIKTVLFETPALIALMLVLGGFVLLAVDRRNAPILYDDAMKLPISVALGIGCFQCLALVPGVSRSGATIVGGLLLGTDKRTAAEFSFFLSMPTMAGAFAYDLYKNRNLLSFDDLGLISIGFAAAFVSAVVVVRWLLGFVATRGFAIFAWWRIVVGGVALTALGLGF